MRTLLASLAVFAMVFLMTVAAPHKQPATPIVRDDVECGSPCVITDSPGGSVIAFKVEALQLLAHDTPIVIDGECLSACTILVDIARKNVCVTKNAVLGYHQPYIDMPDGTTVYRAQSFTTPGLEKYLKEHGGVPADKYDVLLVPYSDLTKFYRACAA